MLGMFATNTRRAQPDAEFLGRWEVVADAASTIVIRRLSKELSCDELLAMVQRIREARLANLRQLRFDFSRVVELAGPWGVHFALLVQLAGELPGRVRMTGLRGQPAALAWIFRRSPEVRSLVTGTPGVGHH